MKDHWGHCATARLCWLKFILCSAGVTAKITGAVAAQLLSRMVGGSGSTAGHIQVIPAFDVPSIKYDPIRRAFYRAVSGRSLLGTAQVTTAALSSKHMIPVMLLPET